MQNPLYKKLMEANKIQHLIIVDLKDKILKYREQVERPGTTEDAQLADAREQLKLERQ